MTTGAYLRPCLFAKKIQIVFDNRFIFDNRFRNRFISKSFLKISKSFFLFSFFQIRFFEKRFFKF